MLDFAWLHTVTMGMTAEEHSTFVDLLAFQSINGRIPDDIRRIQLIAGRGCSLQQIKKTWAAIRPHFSADNEGLFAEAFESSQKNDEKTAKKIEKNGEKTPEIPPENSEEKRDEIVKNLRPFSPVPETPQILVDRLKIPGTPAVKRAIRISLVRFVSACQAEGHTFSDIRLQQTLSAMTSAGIELKDIPEFIDSQLAAGKRAFYPEAISKFKDGMKCDLGPRVLSGGKVSL